MLIVTAVLVIAAWLWYTPEGLLGKADAIGYAVCHRINLRSFHLGERQIPVCARCTGQYLGAMVSMAYLSLFRPRRSGRPAWAILGFLIVFAAAYAVDGLNSYLHLLPNALRYYIYEPSNILRLFTGTGLGLGMGIMLFPAINQTFWKKADSRPVFNGILDFGGLLILALIIDLLVLSGNPLTLFPLALVSAGGVLVLLTMVYTMVVMMVFKVENQIESWGQGTYPLIAGFIIAMVQIAAMDFARYLLTGTWDGFHFG